MLCRIRIQLEIRIFKNDLQRSEISNIGNAGLITLTDMTRNGLSLNINTARQYVHLLLKNNKLRFDQRTRSFIEVGNKVQEKNLESHATLITYCSIQ